MSLVDEMDRPMCNGYVCAYTCNEFAEEFEKSNMRRFMMNYDYEMYVEVDTVLKDALHSAESKILTVTSSLLGLEECDPLARMQSQASIGPERAAIASLGSIPFDTIDQSKSECTLALEVDGKPPGSTCIPIHGSIAVGYYSEKSMDDVIAKSIQAHIVKGANLDFYITAGDGIQRIVYLGEEIQNKNIDSSSALSGGSITMIILSGIAMIAGVLFLARKTFTKKNDEMMFFTPEPKAGKRSGLVAHDSECMRTNLNDRYGNSNSESLDPYEVDSSQGDGAPSILLESQLNASYKNTKLSTISEASKENSSNGNRMSVASPTLSENFNRILSESTYSDGVHSLGATVDVISEFENENVEPEMLYGIDLLNSPPPTKEFL